MFIIFSQNLKVRFLTLILILSHLATSNKINAQIISQDDFENKLISLIENQSFDSAHQYIDKNLRNVDIEEEDRHFLTSLYWLFIIQEAEAQREIENFIDIYQNQIVPIKNELEENEPQNTFSIYCLLAPHLKDTGLIAALFEISERLMTQFESSVNDSLFFYNTQGKYFYTIGQYQKVIDLFGDLNKFKEHPEVSFSELGTAYNQLADSHLKQYNILTALDYYERALDFLGKDQATETQLTILLNNMAEHYSMIGNRYHANDLLKQAISILDKNKTVNKDYALFHRNIGSNYMELDEWDSAETFFLKADSIESILMADSNNIRAITWNQISQNNLRKENYSEALKYGRKAFSLLQKTPYRSPELENTYINSSISVANSLLGTKQYNACLNFTDSLILIEDLFQRQLSPLERALIHYHAGKSFHLKKEYKNAFNELNEALSLISEDVTSTHAISIGLNINLKLNEICEKIKSKSGINYLDEAVQLHYELLKSPIYLEELYKVSEQYSQLYTSQIQDKIRTHEKLLSKQSFHELNNSVKSAKQKDILIQLSKNSARNQSALQNALVLAHLRNEQLKDPNNEALLLQINRIQLELAKSNQIEIHTYLKDQNGSSSLPESDELKLNYYQSDSLFIVTYESNHSRGVNHITIDSTFKTDLSRNLRIISEMPKSIQDVNLDFWESLGQQLLPKNLDLSKYKRININPSGILGYVPFDLLRIDNKYLIESHSISYSYGFSKEQNTQKKTLSYIGISPEYNVLPKLEFAQNEIKKAYALFDDSQHFQKISKQECIDRLSEFEIAHFACHATLSDSVLLDSKLILSDQDEEENLSFREVSTQHSFPDLVILSACNSGNGFLFKSEGVASLAKSFAMAGTSSIITSLWNVNDHSSVIINTEFLKNIKQGLTKSEALRLAKLEYLNSAKLSIHRHPYFWANFVLIGDDIPMYTTSSWLWIMIYILIILCICTLIYNFFSNS